MIRVRQRDRESFPVRLRTAKFGTDLTTFQFNNRIHFIPSSESNAYLKKIKVIFSTVKNVSEKIWNAPSLSEILRYGLTHVKLSS